MNGSTGYVCRLCRFRSVRLPVRHRQRFSTAPGRLQEAVDHDALETPAANVQSYGRYSRRLLIPQNVLEDLRRPSGRADDSRPSAGHSRAPDGVGTPPDAQSRVPIRIERRPVESPNDLESKCKRFMGAVRPRHPAAPQDSRALGLLIDIAGEVQSTEHFKTPSPLQASLQRSCIAWLMSFAVRWSQNLFAGKLEPDSIRPVQAVRAVASIKWPTHAYFPASLWSLSASTLAALNSAKDVPTDIVQAATVQLMLVWNLAMRTRISPSPDPQTSHSDAILTEWAFLPGPKDFAQGGLSDEERVPFAKAISFFVPSTPILSSRNVRDLSAQGKDLYDYPSAALATLDILLQLQAWSGGAKVVEPYRDWIQLIQTMYENAGDYRTPFALSQKLQDPSTRGLYDTVPRRFHLRNNRSFQHSPSHMEHTGVLDSRDGSGSLPNEMDVNSESDSIQSFVSASIGRLGVSIQQKNLQAATRVYSDVQQFVASNTGQLPIEIYEHLLYTFLSLRHSEPIVAIWNDMIRVGHTPTCKTWTILMRGCQNVRDLETMESFWAKMRHSGVQPDHYAWSTRIFGLLRSRRHLGAGLAALGEMEDDWVTAARGLYAKKMGTTSQTKKDVTQMPLVKKSDLLAKFEGAVNGVPRPNVIVMNSAISALAATDTSKIPRVVSWGRAFGAEPNLTTYNALINLSMRQNAPQEAMSLLRKMNEVGIEADSTTWTVLFAAVFEGGMLEGLDPQDVGPHILDLLRDIDSETAGLDGKGYALILDRLLKSYNDHAAAQTILEHMMWRGIQPTAEIYTILMTYYLDRPTPDFAAADSLWSRIRGDGSGHGAALDNVFFDRAIELYAPHHSTVGIQKLTGILDTVIAQGKTLSWRAMETLARALAEAGEWNTVAQLVDRARRERENGSSRTDAFGWRSFWTYVASIGLGGNGGTSGGVNTVGAANR